MPQYIGIVACSAEGAASRTATTAQPDHLRGAGQGRIPARALAYCIEVMQGRKDEGCDAVILGCTEIPLLVSPEAAPLPTLDATRILARAALRKAVED